MRTLRLAALAALTSLTTAGICAAALAPLRFDVPAVSETGGTLPQQFVTGDFDGDGLTDAAVANEGPDAFHGGIAVARGDGAGALLPPVFTALPSGWGACSLAPADFDGDGKLDLAALACTTGGGGPIFVLRGVGDGSFTVGQEIANGALGLLVSSDFNGDGKPDVAFGRKLAGTVDVFFGNGDATFGAPSTYDAPSRVYDLAVGDFDGDSHPDLAGATGASVWTMLNQGDGTFGVPIHDYLYGLQAMRLTLADFDGDQILDVAGVDASGGNVYVALGLGDGHFSPTQQLTGIAMQATWIAAGDFTGDGKTDLVANGDANTVVLLVGAGNGTFGNLSRFVTGPQGLLAVELDGAAPVDLLSFSQDPGRLYATRASGGVLLAPRLTGNEVGGQMRGGDLNGDGPLDLCAGGGRVTPGAIESVVAANLNLNPFGAPLVSQVREETALSGIGDIQLGDVNEDGVLDVVGGFTNFLFSPHNLFVMLGAGDGTFGAPLLTSSGDTHADVVSLGLADVDGDGHLDIVSNTLTQLSARLGNGDGTFGTPILSGSCPVGNTSTLVADFTGDGLLDVAAVIRTGSEDFGGSDIRLNEGHGDGTFTLVQVLSIDSNASGEAADLNADGRPDLAVGGSRGSNGGRSGLFIFLTTAAGRFAPPVYYPRGAGGVVIGDLNEDGAPDVSVGGNAAILVNLNAGDGTFPEVESLPASGGAAVWGDFSGDGKPDLVARIAAYPPSFALYLASNPCTPPAAPTAGNNGPVCAGQTLQLAASTVPGATYRWTGPSGFFSTDQNPAIPNATPDSSGLYAVTAAVDGCVSPPAATSAAIVPLPSPMISVARSVAPGASGLTASVPGHPGDSYVWTLSSGTIQAGQGTDAISFTSGEPGTLMTLTLEEATVTGCAAMAAETVQVDFGDVPASDPFHDAIVAIARSAITAGCGGGNFCPADAVSRSQMSVFLLKGEHGTAFVPPPATGSVFGDVPADAFAADWIEQLAAEGITTGCGGGDFCPQGPVTRAQMAVFLLKVEHGVAYLPPPAAGVFDDVPAGNPFAPWIERLFAEGITGGCGADLYCPGNPTTRGQMAVFLVKTLDLP